MAKRIPAVLAAIVLAAGLWGCKKNSTAPEAQAAGGVGKGGAPTVSTQAGRVPGSGDVQFGTKLGTQ